MDVSQAGPELCSVMGLSIFSAGLGVICNFWDRTKNTGTLRNSKTGGQEYWEKNKPTTVKGGRQKHEVSGIFDENRCLHANVDI